MAGYPFNAKYPPNNELHGILYHGYRNSSEEIFYYDFAVQRYDLQFSFEGKHYYFLSESEDAAQSDATYSNELQRFRDGNDVLENFRIDGKRLIDLIPQIEECEPM